MGLAMSVEGVNDAIQKTSRWSFVSAGIGWLAGVIFGVPGVVNLATANGYGPDIVRGIALLLAGLIVVPPVTAAIRQRVPLLRPPWVPPVAFLAITTIGFGFAQTVMPTGAALDAYIKSAVADASADLARGDEKSARSRISDFAGDAQTHPALAVLIARMDAADAAADAKKKLADDAKAAAAAETTANSSTQASASDSAAPPKERAWHYETTNDAMRGTTTKIAMVLSSDELQFDFPYAGGSTVGLMIRNTAGHEDVGLRVDKGQFICNPFGGAVPVKFDNGPVEKFTCQSTTDGDTSIIFLSPAKRFIRQLRNSQNLTVEPTFFNAGAHQVTFNTIGLKW
jgi:hypothetical protein